MGDSNVVRAGFARYKSAIISRIETYLMLPHVLVGLVIDYIIYPKLIDHFKSVIESKILIGEWVPRDGRYAHVTIDGTSSSAWMRIQVDDRHLHFSSAAPIKYSNLMDSFNCDVLAELIRRCFKESQDTIWIGFNWPDVADASKTIAISLCAEYTVSDSRSILFTKI
jgi:hypothetical protein